MQASTLLAHLSVAHWHVSLQVAASQSTSTTFAERRLVKHLFWTHSMRGVAKGDEDSPAQFSRQASSPHSHSNAQSCCLAHSESPMQFSASALHSDKEHLQVSGQLDASQSTSMAWTANNTVAPTARILDIMFSNYEVNQA